MQIQMCLKALVRSPMSIAVVAMFAAGCATTEPVVHAPRSDTSANAEWAGPVGPAVRAELRANKCSRIHRAPE